MCGIVGIANSVIGEVDRDTVMRMNKLISRRGPDDEGYYWGDRIGLGMRRLAIIDVKAGQQPVHNEDKTIWVVFNGEIYNYRELRGELKKSRSCLSDVVRHGMPRPSLRRFRRRFRNETSRDVYVCDLG